MTWMIIRLILSLGFVALVLFYAARLAKKRGLGQGNGVIEVVARQRMGRSSTVNVVRVADLVLVVGATEEQVTLLAEVDPEAVEQSLRERRVARVGAHSAVAEPVAVGAPALAARSASLRRPRRFGVRPRRLGDVRPPAARADGPQVMTASVRALARPGSTRARVALVLLLAVLCTVAAFLLAGPASAAPGDPVDPTAPVAPTVPAVPGDGNVDISIGDGSPSSSITLILAITVLSIAPSVLLLATSFTKIIVVLALTRNALGLPMSPPNQVLTGLALFLTLFVMGPVFSDINDVAVQPYMDGTMTVSQAYDAGVVPLRGFLLENTREDELQLMIGLSGEEAPASAEEVSMTTLIPAFVLSELKSAFIIGLVVFIPFLVLDMLVSAALMAMGMMMVPPTIVSLPFKLLLFVVVDGWALITTALVGSYGGSG